MKSALIGGTGLYAGGELLRTEQIDTCFGTVAVDIIGPREKPLVFLPRHGRYHSLPPHRINYRANLLALHQLGVRFVLATAAVGSCNPRFPPGSLVILNDFIDRTTGRAATIHEGGKTGTRHFDMTDPYCRNLRRCIKEISADKSIALSGEGVYCCTEGPRFETAAEIRMYRGWGADLVGMTNVPEVVIAKELGMCYAAVGLVVNMATGMKSGRVKLEQGDDPRAQKMPRLRGLMQEVLTQPLDQSNCDCADAIIEL